MGGFILIDRLTNNTVGAGLLHFALRRGANVHWQSIEVDKEAHATLKGQRPAILWLTGLSGAGKSTIANRGREEASRNGSSHVHARRRQRSPRLYKDLGFTEADRVENIRRVAEVAGLMVDAGLIVLVAFISPFRSDRQRARELVDESEFVGDFRRHASNCR